MRPFARYLLPIFSIAVLFVPLPGKAQRIVVEAESYTQSSEIGGAAIQSLPLSGCSGGHILYGLDTPGEWVQYDLPVTASGVFSCTLKCRGVLGRDYAFHAVFTPVEGGDPKTVDFVFQGEGFS